MKIKIDNNEIENNKETLIRIFIQKFSIRNESFNDFLSKIEITGNLLEIKKFINNLQEIYEN